MQYKVTIEGSSTVFDGLENVGSYLNSYIEDEHAENPNSATVREVYAAFGAANAGVAQGGNFSFVFQGERIAVEVEYQGLDDVLDVWAEAEHAYDAEGDTDGIRDEMLLTLPNFGNPEGKWSMIVSPGQTEPDPDYVRSNCSVNFDYYVNGKYVQFACAMGYVIIYPV